jgi:hypothetical protein
MENRQISTTVLPGQLAVSVEQLMAAQEILNQQAASGVAIACDLLPSLNKEFEGAVATNMSPATLPTRMMGLFRIGSLAKDAVSNDELGSVSDVLTVIDLETGQGYAFYASNEGAKKKLGDASKIMGGVLLVLFRGKKPSATPGFNDWADYTMLAFQSEKTPEAVGTYNAVRAKCGLKPVNIR